MALKETKVIDRAEVLRTGDIQIREANEIHDTLTGELKSTTYHRYVISKEDPTPAKVQTFLDNTR